MLPTNPLLNATAPAGPHLPVALLRQYAAGTLAAAAQHRVEAHTLACPRCADVLAGLLQTPPATTDQALLQLQQRLRQRVQQAAAPAWQARKASQRWLAPQLAAAATLLFGLVAGGWWTWQQRHAVPQPVAIMAAMPAAKPALAPPPAPQASAKPEAAGSATHLGRLAAPAQTAKPQPIARHRTAAAPATELEALAIAPVVAPTASTLPKAAPLPVALGEAKPTASPAAAFDSSAALGRVPGLALRARSATAVAAPARVRLDAMPTAPGLPPAPVGGYPAWREKLRHEAAEFKPEAPERALSGSVQLRLTVGADGKVQEIKVLHSLRADYDAEAQRLVCDGPGWVPGIGGGKRAAQSVDVAVPF